MASWNAFALIGWVVSVLIVLPSTAKQSAQDEPEKENQEIMSTKPWAVFKVGDIATERKESGRAYLEFLKKPSLSTGLYHLPAGAVDRQSPHTEDEVYYVIEGRSKFTVGNKELSVHTGSILYVKAGVEHRFHAIAEDLTVLVFFAAGKRTP